MDAKGKSSPNQSPSAENEQNGLLKTLSKLQKLIPLLLLVALLLFLICLLFGYVRGKTSPVPAVTVQQFEISPEIANGVSISGKATSDIVIDAINQTATHASAYQGTDYYRYSYTSAQPLVPQQAMTVPIQVPYGIAFNGISLDSLVQAYDRARYEQWTIGGDIISSPKGLIGRIRLNQGELAKSWETAPSKVTAPADLVLEATNMMLASVEPDSLGRSYMQQCSAPDAEKIFRQWEMSCPLDWRPTYYLSLAYDLSCWQAKQTAPNLHNQAQDADNLADWSRKIEGLGIRDPCTAPIQSVHSEQAPAAHLAKTTRLALKTFSASDNPPASGADQTRDLNILAAAENEATTLSESNPKNAGYRVQRARIRDQEAMIQLSLNPSLAPALEENAISDLSEAIKEIPENAGLYQQRAMLYLDLVNILTTRDQGQESPEAQATELEELNDYTRALEGRPSESEPLWGAVYLQIHLKHFDDAVDLARTLTLLEPDSIDAGLAFIVAVEGAQTGLPLGDTEDDIEARLKTLLQRNLNDTQMRVLYWALYNNHNHNGSDLVAAEGKRLFPCDATFGTPNLAGCTSASQKAALLQPITP